MGRVPGPCLPGQQKPSLWVGFLARPVLVGKEAGARPRPAL